MSDRDQAVETLLGALDAAGLEVDRTGERSWMTMLSGEWKRTIPLLLRVDERNLHVQSLLCGAPDDGHADVYAILLHRNERPAPVHFALDDEGDVILTGHTPLATLDAPEVDRLLGAVLTISDETFNQVLRAGFGDYIEAEQRWRAKNGMPPNPVSTA